MSASTLRVDQLAREFWNRCAVAVGIGDKDLALECCKVAVEELEPVYRLALRVGESAKPAPTAEQRGPSKPIRLASKFSGRCRSCGTAYAEGDPIFWVKGLKGALCNNCGKAGA